MSKSSSGRNSEPPRSLADTVRAAVREGVHDFFEPTLLLLRVLREGARMVWRWLVRHL